MKKLVYKGLPEHIRVILLVSEGWLVGSAVDNIIKGEEPKDYDIIVPSRENFQRVCLIMKNNIKGINTFGGVKADICDTIVDIWPEELDHYLKTANTRTSLFCLKGGILIQHAT